MLRRLSVQFLRMDIPSWVHDFFRSTRETDGTLDFTGVWLFEALGVQFWGKSNPAVVVAVG
ncbi:MAG: hypothetical protein ABSF15_20675, partial [Candidatus Sulfotelmatobacter sp.]